jgi:hypothetical protein
MDEMAKLEVLNPNEEFRRLLLVGAGVTLPQAVDGKGFRLLSLAGRRGV